MKKYLLVLIFSLIGLTVAAQDVSIEDAQRVALFWFRNVAQVDEKVNVAISKSIEYKYWDKTNFYIFTIDKGGFVLVSANFAAEPILGYAVSGTVPEEINHPAVKSWFDNYARQIDTLRYLPRNEIIPNPKWQGLLNGQFPESSSTSVGPLLTTTWDQGWPYNAMCPADPNGPGGHTQVGCTAVAMAQIIRYWSYPERGVGYHSYIPRFNPQLGAQSIFFNETVYQWNSMGIIANNSSYEAISELTYHAGVSANMDYSANGSAAHLYRGVEGFIRNFDYSDSISQVYRSETNDSMWVALIMENLSLYQPILMEGYDQSQSSGHAFVCDGYDTNGLFHMNWGWSGSADGYYNINQLTPSWFNFNDHQSMIVNIKPNFSNLNARFATFETDVNYEIHFLDFSVSNPDICYWDFGDSVFSSLRNPIHLYQSPGDYEVTLIVQKGNFQDTVFEMIKVERQAFLLTNNSLQGSDNSILGVDYNDDNLHDIIILGHNGVAFYNNTNSTIELDIINFPFIQISPCWAEVVDLYNTNQAQFFVSGQNSFNSAQKYNFFFHVDDNNSLVYDTLKNIQFASNQFSFADFDNDGKIDFLFGNLLYRNLGNLVFKYICNIGSINGKSAWCDFNLDGLIDVAIGGRLFRNNGNGIFEDIGVSYEYKESINVSNDNYEWGDFNSDGFPDLLTYNNIIINLDGTQFITYEFLNEFPTYQPGIYSSWADIDNDGDLDVISIISGVNCCPTSYYQMTSIFLNEQDSLVLLDNNLQPLFDLSSIGWIDYDNNHSIDLLLTGYFTSTYGIGNNWTSLLYSNNAAISNQPPTAPGNLHAINYSDSTVLSWNKSYDDHTSQNSLTYNIYVYNANDSLYYVSPLSDINSGFLKTPSIGNGYFNNFMILKNLPNGKYYWSVQAIDNSYAGSSFSVTDSFEISGINLPPEMNHLLLNGYLNNDLNFYPQQFYGDYIDPEKDSLKQIRIDILPISGVLYYSGLPVMVNQIIHVDSLINLVYRPSDLLNDMFFVSVSDGNSWSTYNSKVEISINLFQQMDLLFPNTIGPVAFGDYNNDRYLDIVVDNKIFRNDNGSLVELGITLIGDGDVFFDDIDSDGYYDILIDKNIYINNGNDSFVLAQTLLPTLYESHSNIGDINNNNMIDYVSFGTDYTSGINSSILYLNTGQEFLQDSLNQITGFRNGAADFGDFNNDGKVDLTICGIYSGNDRKTTIYLNDFGIFVEDTSNLPGVNVGSIEWCDFDRDGDLDLLICGSQGTTWDAITKIYVNSGGVFYEMASWFPGIYRGFATWFDFDVDGFSDIVLSGFIDGSGNKVTKLYKNNNGVNFTEVQNDGLPDLSYSSFAKGDFNNDGYLDLLLSGINRSNETITAIFRNCLGLNSSTNNLPPTPPTNLHALCSDTEIVFTWDISTDNTTPPAALTYNIYVMRAVDSSLVVSPMADINTGFRKVVKRGNAITNFYILKDLPPGEYYWSVQAIDNSFAGSEFSPMQALCYPKPAQADFISGPITVCQGETSVTYSVQEISDATSYVWTLPTGATGTSNTNIIIVDYSSSAISGDITVKGVNDCSDGVASTLPIIVKLNTASSITESVCDSYTAPNGQMYTTSGTKTAIIPNNVGCDSIITINLTVNQSSSSSINEIVCNSYTAPDGQMYTTSGTKTAIIQNTAGCDSIITINLTVNQSSSSSINEIVCNSYTAPDGQMYTTSGTKTAIIANNVGCDSIITINLTVNQNSSNIINETVCDSYIAPDGQTYTTSGTKMAIIPNTYGCDSIITINLTVHQSSSSTINETVCNSYTAPDGQNYTTSGTKTAIIPNSVGCDSAITINLTVKQSSSSTINDTVCNSYSAPDGQIYTTSGTKTAIIPNTSGCDSTITINLTVNQSTSNTINATVCNSYTAPDGQFYTSSGTKTAIIPNSVGCDSTITINLTVKQSTSNTINATVCDTYTAPDGQIYTTSGTKTAILPNSVGCDSVITINLTVKQSTTQTLTETVCNAYTAPDGQIYTTSGTNTAIISNAVGCDSTITINLTVNQSSSNTITEIVCDSYTSPDGQIYTTSGTKTAIIPNTVGCDSTITINLTINQSSSSTISETVCDSYTAPDGQIYTTSGTKTAILPNSVGCDSVITINLTVNETPVTPTIVLDFDRLISSSILGNQWFNQNGVIPNETDQELILTQNGTYYVIVSQNDCFSNPSNSILVNNVKVEELNRNLISINPNPFTNQLTIINHSSETYQYYMYNGVGQIVLRGTLENEVVLNTSDLAKGLYIIKFVNSIGQVFYKVVKQ